jgi:hypothetical protein
VRNGPRALASPPIRVLAIQAPPSVHIHPNADRSSLGGRSEGGFGLQAGHFMACGGIRQATAKDTPPALMATAGAL